MTLCELTLMGEVDKVGIAIKRLQAHEPPEGYYLAFSGGKDSTVILALAKEAGVKFDAHYHMTTVDPPELVHFVRSHPEVNIGRGKSMWEVVREHGMLPTRTRRFCCRELKEGGGDGRIVITGVRWEESARRSKLRYFEACMQFKTKRYLHPIIDWTSEDVWEYIRTRNLPYCSLYDEGFKRIGCVLCPFVRNVEREMARWPKLAAQYRRMADVCVDVREQRGFANGEADRHKFASGQEYWDWWIDRDATLPNDDQMDLGVYE